jgi:hypothetical protein
VKIFNIKYSEALSPVKKGHQYGRALKVLLVKRRTKKVKMIYYICYLINLFHFNFMIVRMGAFGEISGFLHISYRYTFGSQDEIVTA